MSAIRRQLRLGVMAWLVLQAASLSAFVPRDCCAAHKPGDATPGCHEETSATVCPMRSADGTACPMHRESEPGSARGAECAMQGSCAGPMAALAALLSQHGVTPAALSIPLDLRTLPAAARAAEQVVSRFVPPDSPPPRL
jgi:hypothetical protein